MEISPIHHGVVVGKQNLNLKVIMQRTKTTILFPDVRLILEKAFGFDEYDSFVLVSNDVSFFKSTRPIYGSSRRLIAPSLKIVGL